MDPDVSRKFNEEVERYRKSLVYYAKACEWDTFKKKAGSLFDYLESIELTELEKKFYRIFRTLLVVVIIATALILKLDSGIFPSLVKYKSEFMMAALSACSFELYFYLDFRMYVKGKMSVYKQRKAWFIRNIENDFRAFIAQPDASPVGVGNYEQQNAGALHRPRFTAEHHPG